MTIPQEDAELRDFIAETLWKIRCEHLDKDTQLGLDAIAAFIKARDEQREKQLFTPQQVDSLVAQAEWQLLDELDKAIPRKTYRLDSFLSGRRRALTNPQEQDNAPNITTHPDGTVEIIVHKEEE